MSIESTIHRVVKVCIEQGTADCPCEKRSGCPYCSGTGQIVPEWYSVGVQNAVFGLCVTRALVHMENHDYHKAAMWLQAGRNFNLKSVERAMQNDPELAELAKTYLEALNDEFNR